MVARAAPAVSKLTCAALMAAADGRKDVTTITSSPGSARVRAEPGETIGQAARQRRCVPAVRIEVRVQDVDVQVQPVTGQLGAVHDGRNPVRRSLDACSRFGRRDEQRECRADLGEILVILAAPDVDDIARVEARTATVPGYRGPVPADRGGEVFTRQARAHLGVAGVAEIGVGVDVDQPEAAPGPQRLPGTQQAAVTAQDQRRVTGVQKIADPGAEPVAEIKKRLLIAEPA